MILKVLEFFGIIISLVLGIFMVAIIIKEMIKQLRK